LPVLCFWDLSFERVRLYIRFVEDRVYADLEDRR
jgi:hypothetical protein